MLLRGLYLREVHAQANLREKMHDDALVLLHRLTLSVVITVIMAIKLVWRQQQRGPTQLQQPHVPCLYMLTVSITYFSRGELQLCVNGLIRQINSWENNLGAHVPPPPPPPPASVVPLDMDELRDSVVSGRFNAVSSLVRGEAAGGPEGLQGRGGGAGEWKGGRKQREISQIKDEQ